MYYFRVNYAKICTFKTKWTISASIFPICLNSAFLSIFWIKLPKCTWFDSRILNPRGIESQVKASSPVPIGPIRRLFLSILSKMFSDSLRSLRSTGLFPASSHPMVSYLDELRSQSDSLSSQLYPSPFCLLIFQCMARELSRTFESNQKSCKQRHFLDCKFFVVFFDYLIFSYCLLGF